MKKALKISIALLCICIFFHAIYSYAWMDLNPSSWSKPARGFELLLTLGFGFITAVVILLKEEE